MHVYIQFDSSYHSIDLIRVANYVGEIIGVTDFCR